MKHTKGKWNRLSDTNYSKGNTESRNDFLGSSIHCNGKYICLMIHHNSTGNMPQDEIEETEANAKLISKAPEMYEALKVVIETNHAYGHTEGSTLAKIESLLKEIES